eukprot:TRINITY_DN4741_c0_g1_i1.p1 TRINITY_DN4741_c0_g1~~TRINITY_DN4741_c0_g1_i1.p1  ORF type:complete len:594 (+),score=101.24 TRINITY_DN4741_c0_g1_i1:117-1898(+)
MAQLQGSTFLRAAQHDRVLIIPDLLMDCPSNAERQLIDAGARSLLLIPLLVSSSREEGDDPYPRDPGQRQLVGLVGLTCSKPSHFAQLDIRFVGELIDPLTVAFRQAFQQRFTRFSNIHPSVEWRFIQESERRAWGLPPEPIVFQGVYPLYGLSDIRGSSAERNHVIQKDLLAQFRLGQAVLDAVCQSSSALGHDSVFAEMLRMDLLEHLERISKGVTVDSEAISVQFLSEHLESHFDFFLSSCGPETAEAVRRYREAINNEHHCVYVARENYDRTIRRINGLLRGTWELWQQRMQEIAPHYCDLETTDGIDHMIYAGASISPKFTPFHLHCLKFEQLRAVCDCARTALCIQERCGTQMQVCHLVLVQDNPVDIYHDEKTESLFDVKGTRDTRYEIVKKRIDKAREENTSERITQPGSLTIAYSTPKEWHEYQRYLQYLAREGWVEPHMKVGKVEALQGITGLKFARVKVLPPPSANPSPPPPAQSGGSLIIHSSSGTTGSHGNLSRRLNSVHGNSMKAQHIPRVSRSSSLATPPNSPGIKAFPTHSSGSTISANNVSSSLGATGSSHSSSSLSNSSSCPTSTTNLLNCSSSQ